MGMQSLSSYIDIKYGNTLTLMDVINDSKLCENMEKFYVPQVEIRESIFIKKDENIAITENGRKRIRFILLNQYGKNITNPDSSYIQIPANKKGFLARLNVSGNSYTASNLEMDYLIDISNIKYTIDSEIMAFNNNIGKTEKLYFDTLEFRDYSGIDFDNQIKEFVFNKGQLFHTYFRI